MNLMNIKHVFPFAGDDDGGDDNGYDSGGESGSVRYLS